MPRTAFADDTQEKGKGPTMFIAKLSKTEGFLALALAFAGALAFGSNASADYRDVERYKVTIVNATKGQPLAPGLVITHGRRFSLFKVGDAATDPLAKMAETGDPGDLQTAVSGSTATADIVPGTGGGAPLTLPSESAHVEITTRANYLTAVGMLAGTNDAFYAVQRVRLPRRGSVTVYAPAFDAGSEENNEANGDVPASPAGNASDTGTNVAPKEGFIHVHNGIHGVGDLAPATYDWHNPVVLITIERIGG